MYIIIYIHTGDLLMHIDILYVHICVYIYISSMMFYHSQTPQNFHTVKTSALIHMKKMSPPMPRVPLHLSSKVTCNNSSWKCSNMFKQNFQNLGLCHGCWNIAVICERKVIMDQFFKGILRKGNQLENIRLTCFQNFHPLGLEIPR